MTNSISIEFFHDTICSFCFPMSYKMRKVKQILPDISIIHRSFALVRDEGDFDDMFHSRAQAKEEVLGHWAQANRVDPLHRFNIEGMRKADFPFPVSLPALLACKAAGMIAGEEGYWELFDKLQQNLFVDSLNIQNEDVIVKAVQSTTLDVNLWKGMYHSPKVLQAVESDFALAEKYGIHEVPTLIVNQRYRIRGALEIDDLVSAIQSVVQYRSAQT